MNNKEAVLEFIKEQIKCGKKGVSAKGISEKLNMQRSNASAILNDLYKGGTLLKVKGKPVLYTLNAFQKAYSNPAVENANFDMLIGSSKSLKKCIQQAKAAMLYPPHGLHTLIVGPSGVGKTMFAELMYKFSVENGIFDANAPFEVFNCADYANNPQLLLSYLFGCRKGTFTGADKDREGIVEKADRGILFLDEIHRLPPEGQEMLFYLIDKGAYTPLGGDTKKKSEVLIICATTENIDTLLLTTFTRRIPMNIKIPALAERGFDERYELICEFFKAEAARIKKKITVSSNTIRQLLLYDCPGNVGQLKSDIQLGCANAFLNSASKKLNDMEVHCTDFASYVNQGLLIYKNYSKEVDRFVIKGNILCFTPNGKKNCLPEGDYSLPDNFYEMIEKKMQELQQRGASEEDLKLIMEPDIQNYFKHFIKNFEDGINEEELSKIVDKNIIYIVENFLKIAGQKFQRIFPTKVFCGLCLHVDSSIKRLKSNKKIVNFNLKNIKENNKEEFEISKKFVETLEKMYDLNIPEDEAGFIAMFLMEDETKSQCVEDRPIVVIAMHGRSTASSMAEVVNTLVGGNNAYAYDMSLDKKSETAYEELKDIIVKKNQGNGVLLLADMGSFGIYGELISKDTGIDIKVIDMVSTPIAIECARKAVIEPDINKIYEYIRYEISHYTPYKYKVSDKFIPDKDNIILTMCTTGEGSALKLKNYIEEKVCIKDKNIEIFAVALNNKQHMYNLINNLSKEKNILAIVGTINPDIYGIPYISTYDVLKDKDCKKIKEIVESSEKVIDCREEKLNYDTFIDVLKDDITNMDLYKFEKLYVEFIDNIQKDLGMNMDYNIKSGLMIHMACCINKLISGESIPNCYSKDSIKQKYAHEFAVIKDNLKKIGNEFEINFSDDEICFILRNIMMI